jgi:hypothetical protein
MKSSARYVALIAALVSAVAGCTLRPEPQDPPAAVTAQGLANIAWGTSYYGDVRDQAVSGGLESADLEAVAGAPQSSLSLISMALGVADWTYVQPDGTTVEIVQITDDRGTAADATDDIVNVTRTYRVWDDTTEKIEKITRPARPEAGWPGWDNDVLVQEGTVDEFLQGVRVKTGALTVTWNRVGSDVVLREIVKDLTRVDKYGFVDRLVITVDDNGAQTKKMSRTRLSPQGGLDVVCITFDQVLENGISYTRGTFDDGATFIVRSERDPRVVEQYTPGGILWSRKTETASGRQRAAVIDYFDAQGNIVNTVRQTFAAQFLGDSVLVRRTDGGRLSRMLITENERGFTVRGDRVSFTVWFVGNSVQVYDGSMHLIGTVVFDDQGGCQVYMPTGTTTVQL